MNDEGFKVAKEKIEKVLWWVPFKNLRHSLRQLFYDIIDLKISHQELLNANKTLNNNIVFLLSEINKNTNGTIIQKIGGGLADQILCYTMGIYFEIYYNKEVKYSITVYGKNIDGIRNSPVNRNFELKNIAPNLELNIASDEEINLFKSIYHIKITRENIDDIMTKYNNIYNDIAPHRILPTNNIAPEVLDILRERFDLDKTLFPQIKDDKQNFEYYKKITECKCSVALHIRRGDYFKQVELMRKGGLNINIYRLNVNTDVIVKKYI